MILSILPFPNPDIGQTVLKDCGDLLGHSNIVNEKLNRIKVFPKSFAGMHARETLQKVGQYSKALK